MRKLLCLVTFPLLLAACQQPATSSEQPDCIDASKIRTDAICTMEYAPVCGCDGKVYSNACMATNAGVTSYTKGECK